MPGELTWLGAQIVANLQATMEGRMRQATELLATDVKRSMRGGGAPHTPSRPGEPPAVDTGAYRAAIYADVQRAGAAIVGRVVSPSPQARALELGYAPGGLAPRPHLRPALSRNRARIAQILGAPLQSRFAGGEAAGGG